MSCCWMVKWLGSWVVGQSNSSRSRIGFVGLMNCLCISFALGNVRSKVSQNDRSDNHLPLTGLKNRRHHSVSECRNPSEMRVLTISHPVLYQQQNPVPYDQSDQHFEICFCTIWVIWSLRRLESYITRTYRKLRAQLLEPSS